MKKELEMKTVSFLFTKFSKDFKRSTMANVGENMEKQVYILWVAVKIDIKKTNFKMALHLSPEMPTSSSLSLGNKLLHSLWTKCSFQHLNNNKNWKLKMSTLR